MNYWLSWFGILIVCPHTEKVTHHHEGMFRIPTKNPIWWQLVPTNRDRFGKGLRLSLIFPPKKWNKHKGKVVVGTAPQVYWSCSKSRRKNTAWNRHWFFLESGQQDGLKLVPMSNRCSLATIDIVSTFDETGGSMFKDFWSSFFFRAWNLFPLFPFDWSTVYIYICFIWGGACGKKATTIITLQGINISHLGKRKIIFKMPFLGDVLVPWRVLNLLKNTSVDLDSYWPAEVSVVIFNPSNFKGHFFLCLLP